MKFKVKDTPIDQYSSNPLGEYLNQLGVNKVNSFINQPESIDEEEFGLLTNINKGIEMLKKHIDNDSKIFLQVDSDTDGYTSAAILYAFLIENYPEIDIEYNIHPEKEHGIFLDDVDYSYDLVIVPDAGSNQEEEMEELSLRADVLIIDHHIVDVDISSEKVIVINNQTSSFFSNKSLSGAGMVYKFIQAYSQKYDLGDAYLRYQDLAAIGIVADSMDTRNLDNNYIIYHGLGNVINPLVKAMLKARAFSVSSVDKPTKIDIAFYVAPMINGLIRFGTMEEKREFFYALVNYDIDEISYRENRKGEQVAETYYDLIAKLSSSVKAKQDASVKKVMPILEHRIESNGLDKNQIIICKTSKTNADEVPKTVTGLVAMRLVNKYKKPVAVVRPIFNGDKITYAGSGRASAADGFDSFKNYLTDTELVIYASGHDQAFGVAMPEENIDKITELANEQLKDVDFGSATVEVDLHLKGSLPTDLLLQFAEASHLYGNGIPEPKFLFDLILSSNDVQAIGKAGSTMKFVQNGITFIKFWAADELEELRTLDKNGLVRVLGRPQINEFNGRKSVQILVQYVEILEREVSLF